MQSAITQESHTQTAVLSESQGRATLTESMEVTFRWQTDAMRSERKARILFKHLLHIERSILGEMIHDASGTMGVHHTGCKAPIIIPDQVTVR